MGTIGRESTSRGRNQTTTRSRRTARVGRFPAAVIDKLRDGNYLRIRAGMGDHRFIGIWVVVVENRAFVRSWSIKPRSWYRTFLEDPRGAIVVDDREIKVRARRVTSERLNAAIDRAYLDKYKTPGSLKYARDLGRAKSRATTTELIPA
jgi:hypothetical protein